MEALENLDVWKRACSLSVDVYRVLANCRDAGFKDQVTRSGLSIPSNIAEGYERDSSKSCAQYLRIAKGSCGELWTQLLIGRKIGIIPAEEGKRLEAEVRGVSKMLYGLLKHYESDA